MRSTIRSNKINFCYIGKSDSLRLEYFSTGLSESSKISCLKNEKHFESRFFFLQIFILHTNSIYTIFQSAVEGQELIIGNDLSVILSNIDKR